MLRTSPGFFRSLRPAVHAAVIAGLTLVALPSSAHAQDAITKEAAAAAKAAFVKDLENLRVKFVGLAEAFPQDKYTWRPMDGVRSVSEVLMLLATEGYSFAPGAFGAQPGLAREEAMKLNAVTDKTQVIGHLNKAFAYAKQAIGAVDPATLVGSRNMMGQQLTTPEIALFMGGDMHEHLGQLIAYARMNRIVPPWSK